jgi:hypothetical protein
MMSQKALFMTFVGEQACELATRLQKCEFETVVANCADTHSCFVSRGVVHKYCADEANATILDNFCEDLRADKVYNGVVVVTCESSLSTATFEANMQLR